MFPCNFLMSSEFSFVFLILITTGACFGPRSSVGAGQGSALCKGRVLGEESTSQVLVSLLQDLREVLVSSWFKERACMLSGFSWVRLFATLWTVDHQAPLSRQEYWSGLPFCSPVQRAVWQLHETTRRRDLAQGLAQQQQPRNGSYRYYHDHHLHSTDA